VPYIETSKARRKHRVPIPSALAALPDDPTRPFAESSSGLGSAAVTTSGRAAHLKRLQEYEEENFTRLIMKKADTRRRARDEADLAMGGGLGTSGSRSRMQAGTFEDAFGDVLKSIDRRDGRTEEGFVRDGYEELRRGKNGDALERSRRREELGKRSNSAGEDELDNTARRKRTRFELQAKVAKKKLSKRRR
jgi:U3 small nucleolar ribonucleoprotein protein LCP5